MADEIENNNVVPLTVRVQNVEAASGHLDTMGIITSWSPNGEANLEPIMDVCRAIGFEHLAPRPRTLKDALRAALTGKFSKKNRRVAPAGKGYEVLIENPVADEVRVTQEHVVSCWIEIEGEDQFVVTDVPEFTVDGETFTADDLASWVDAAKKRVDGTALGECLSAIGAALNGVAIRDAGGGYWLPSGSIGRWTALVEGLNAAGRPMRMRVWDTASSPRSIESTIDSIRSLVDRKCDEILGAVESGDLGVRALTTKTEEAINLVAQLGEYESALGTGLENLRVKVLGIQTATVQATMLAQAQKEEKLRARASGALIDEPEATASL